MWTHPMIDELANFKTVDWLSNGEVYNTNPVFYVELETKDKISFIIFKSEWFEKQDGYIALSKDDWTNLSMSIECVLFGDVWSPGGRQFLEDDMYEILSNAHGFGKGFNILVLTGDIGLYKDVNGSYTFV